MKPGLPLSLRLLLGVFLNFLLLGALGWALFQGQFGLGLDTLLASRAGDRLQSMAEVLGGELARTPKADWDAVLARSAAAYELQLLVLRPDGQRWAGEALEVPPEVRQRLGDRPPGDFRPNSRRDPSREPGRPPEFRPSSDPLPDPKPSPASDAPPPERERGGPPPPNPNDPRRGPGGRRPRFLLRAGTPPQYWAGLALPGLTNPEGRPVGAILLAVASSLTAGGWVLDPLPWLLGGFGAVLLSLLLWYPLVRGLTRSIRAMTHATERLAEGQFDVSVPVDRRDELGRLGTAINHLSHRLQHFVHGQRRFLGDIAHELCSPLARMQLGASLIQREATPAQRERIEDVREEVVLMTRLVDELLTFSKVGLQSRTATLQTVNLAALARQVADREAAPPHSLSIDIPDSLAALAEPDLLARAVANLLRNALRYAATAGPILLTAHAQGHHAILSVADHGPGVPESELDRIFEPFYRPDTARTREAGGTGLGLAIVRTCVAACQGTVAAHLRQPSGLLVQIRLQLAK